MPNRNKSTEVDQDISTRFEENLDNYRDETGGISWRDRLASLRSRDIAVRRTYVIGSLVALVGGILGLVMMRRRRPASQGQMLAKRIRANSERKAWQLAKKAKHQKSAWSRA